ncbi:MAG: hypothetical protein KC636_14115, partial [Myxococcales bacterium]|nr:hypothetical protein [Myxococcales bacterium]
MLDDLRDLAAAIAGGSSKVTARLAALAVFAIVADVLLLRALMEGLELRHAGLPTGGAVIKAVVALASTCLVTRGLYVEVATRSADLAKAQVQRIAAALPRLPLVEIDALNRGALLTRILGDSNVVASESRELLRATSGMLRLVIGSLFVLVISQTAFAVAVVGVILIAITAIGRVIMVRDGISRVADDDASFYDRLREQIDGAVPIRLSRDRSAAIAAELEALSIRRRVIRTEIFTRFYANQY